MDQTPGSVVGGRYRVVSKIAQGGMGSVYRAQHTLSRKMVALKVIHAEASADETTRQRFLREVAAPAEIGHRGLVEIYDAGFEGGALFVAMELLEGETLRELFDRGPIPTDRVFSIFLRLLEPLAAAHTAGFVHRDLKPENVFLQRTSDGLELVKLLDFGIARHLRGDSEIVTQAGVAMGTPHYMSPEQAASARDVSETTDVWAVGVMLYEALTGSPPFRGDTLASLVVDVLTRPHRPLIDVVPSASSEVSLLLDRVLDKAPERRPASAGVLLAALRTALDRPEGGSGVHAIPAAAITAPMSVSSPGSVTGRSSPGVSSAIPSSNPSSNHSSSSPPTVDSMPVFGVTSRSRTPAATVPLSEAERASALFEGRSSPGAGAPRNPSAVAPPRPTGRSRTTLFALLGLSLGGVGLIGVVLSVAVGSWVCSSVASRSHSGTLDFTDPRLATGTSYDTYEYAWPVGEHVTLDVTSEAFDPQLIVQAPSGNQMHDDAYLPGAHLELVTTEGGLFRVLVSGSRVGDVGDYRLRVH